MMLKIIWGETDNEQRWWSSLLSYVLPRAGETIIVEEGELIVQSVVHDYVNAEVRVYCNMKEMV